MVIIEELKKIHLELKKRLIEKQRDLNIDSYMSYINEKLEVYELYKTTGLISYLDEFEIDSEFRKEACKFIERMNQIIERGDL